MMARNAAKELQRLVEDEIGARPKLIHCGRILAGKPRVPGETREAFYARMWTENEAALRASAAQRAEQHEHYVGAAKKGVPT